MRNEAKKLLLMAFLITSATALAEGSGMDAGEWKEFQSHRVHIEGLNRIVGQHRAGIDSNTGRIEVLEKRKEGMNSEEVEEMRSHRENIENLSSIADSHKKAIDVNSADIAGLKGLKTSVEKNTDTTSLHAEHIAALEEIVRDNHEDLDDTNVNVNTLGTKVDNNNKAFIEIKTSVEKRIGNNEKTLKGTANKIAGNSSNISKVNEVVNSNVETNAMHAEHIAALEEIVRDNHSDLDDTNVNVDKIDKTVALHDATIVKNQKFAVEKLNSQSAEMKANKEADKVQSKMINDNTTKLKSIDQKHTEELEKAKEAGSKKDVEHDKQLKNHTEQLNSQSNEIAKVSRINESQDSRINSNTRAINDMNDRIDDLDTKLNQGMSLMAAMTAVDFQTVETGEIGIGFGVGHYTNSQGVAVGIAYAPTDSLIVNAKYSMNTGHTRRSAVAMGATFKFKVNQ